jgi:hypothetical protein
MKTISRVFYLIALLEFFNYGFSLADNVIEVIRSAPNTLEVRLSNSDEIYSILFTLRTSSDIVLGTPERGARTSESNWIVESYKPNDSTVNVIIMNWELKSLGTGFGTLVRIPFTCDFKNEESYASISKVMVTNRTADSLGIAVNNLNWSNTSRLVADNEQGKDFQLNRNYPNPFNPSTKIAYKLNKEAQVKLSVYDIRGREVKQLINTQQPIGEYCVEWNSESNNGDKLASGMYIARLSVDNESISRKMILTK